MSTPGERIRKVREYFNLSQGEFAQRLSMKQSLLSYIESNKRKASDKMLEDLYARFKARPEWIENGTGDMLDGVPAVEEPKSKSMTDLEVLETIFTAIENYLYRKKTYIEPTTKAKLILSFYKYYLETDTIELNAFRERIETSMDAVTAIL